MLLRIFKDPVTRLKLIIVFFGFLIFSGVIIGASFNLTSNPAFCAKCHEMKPQYSTWRVSSHSNITCTECHIKPGVRNTFNVKLNSLGKVYLHFNESYFLPIQLATEIKSDICLRCHSLQREFNASGDILIPHDKHVEKNVECLECHSGIVHGEIAQRLETIDGDFKRWNPIMAKIQVVPENKVINMKQCLNCHLSKKVQVGCEGCHKTIRLPETHKEKSWINSHGLDAKNDLNSCDKCHSYSNLFGLEDIEKTEEPLTKPTNRVEGSTIRVVIDYARTNTFCFTCHQQRPKSHERSWGYYHPLLAQKDSSGCFVCHDYSKKRVLNLLLGFEREEKNVKKNTKLNNYNAATTTCSQCHIQQHIGFNREVHPVPVPVGTRYNQSCVSCHNVENCSKCHSVKLN